MRAILLIIATISIPSFAAVCTEGDKTKLMIESMQSRFGIECVADQKYLICSSALGPAYLDLLTDRNSLIAEGYWTSRPNPEALAWVSIELTTKRVGKTCQVKDFSFNSAVED